MLISYKMISGNAITSILTGSGGVIKDDNMKIATIEWTPRQNQTGMNDFILMAIDEHGATSAHEFQVHVFHDPSSKQLVNTGWPLMLTFVGVVFAWGMSSL